MVIIEALDARPPAHQMLAGVPISTRVLNRDRQHWDRRTNHEETKKRRNEGYEEKKENIKPRRRIIGKEVIPVGQYFGLTDLYFINNPRKFDAASQRAIILKDMFHF